MTAKMEERWRNRGIATGRSFRRLVGKARSPVQWRKSGHQLNWTLDENIRVMTNLDARATVSDVLHRSAPQLLRFDPVRQEPERPAQSETT